MGSFEENVVVVISTLKSLSQDMQREDIEDHKLVKRRSQVRLMNPENRDFIARLNEERLQASEDFQETLWSVAVQSLTDEYGQEVLDEALKRIRAESG